MTDLIQSGDFLRLSGRIFELSLHSNPSRAANWMAKSNGRIYFHTRWVTCRGDSFHAVCLIQLKTQPGFPILRIRNGFCPNYISPWLGCGTARNCSLKPIDRYSTYGICTPVHSRDFMTWCIDGTKIIPKCCEVFGGSTENLQDYLWYKKSLTITPKCN